MRLASAIELTLERTMTDEYWTRRRFVQFAIASASAAVAGQHAVIARAAGLPPIKVARDASCGCCALWADHLREAGFPVEVNDRRDLMAFKARLGVPSDLVSCHTAEVAGYVVEGHVPATAIIRLLETKESIKGLAVPRMPIGSPGMESGDPASWPVYEVTAFSPEGRKVFARYRGAAVL